MTGMDFLPDAATPVLTAPTRADRLSRLYGSRWVRDAAGVVLLAILYRGAAEIGYVLQFAGPVAAIVWLPVGVGISFLYLGGLRFWPGVLIGDILANDYSALPLGAAAGQTCGNLLEVVVATLLLLRLTPRGGPLGSVSGLGRMLLSIAVGTAVSATIGSTSLLAGSVIGLEEIGKVWRTWWLGDATGALIVVPLAIAWAAPTPGWWRHRGLEAGLVLAAIAALSGAAMRNSDPFAYLVFSPLLWAALRLGRRGATAAVAVAAGFAIAETTRRVGPFAADSVTMSVLATQLYIAVVALSTLCVAAVVAEREAFAGSLAASRARIVTSAAAERRRMERDLHDGVQQRLAALIVRMQLALDHLRDDPDVAEAQIRAAEAQLSEAIDELRELAHGIHPARLAEQGLEHALLEMAKRCPVPVRVRQAPSARVDPTAEMTAYYVASEAVTNALKYAHAGSVDIWASAAHGKLRIEIADDGRGGASEAAGSGLQGLRDRVEAIGGSLEVVSPAGHGTRIRAELPRRQPVP
jgi:signal transduction histidine kinase